MMAAKPSLLSGRFGGRFGALFALCLVLLIDTGNQHPAAAHQAKAAITEVLFNPRSGNLEIAHRFIAHDAEHAARILFDVKADIIKSEKVREDFAAYVADTFSLTVDDNQQLNLTLLGVELDRDFVWVYQEIALPPEKIAKLTVQHRTMADLWPAQINTVNVARNGVVKTVTFVGREAPKAVLL